MVRPVVKDDRWDGRRDEFWKLFNVRMGDAKVYFGVVNNAMIYYVRDAVSYASEHCGGYRVRQKVKFVWKWLSMLEYRLKTDSVGWFDPKNFGADRQRGFSDDVNADKLYDHWVASAGKGYGMLSGGAGVFRHRCELIVKDWGCKDAGVVGWLTAAQWMLNCQSEIYKYWVDDTCECVGLTRDSCRALLGNFSLEGLRDCVEKLLYVIYPEAETRVASELEQHQLNLAWESVDKVFGDSEFLFGGAIDAVMEDDEVFRSVGWRRKMAVEMAKAREVFDEGRGVAGG